MELYAVITIIIVWLLFNLVLKLANKMKADYSYIVTFAFALSLGYFYFTDMIGSTYYDYFTYALIGFFILILMMKVLVSLFRKDISTFEYHQLEKNLAEINEITELLRKRFISTIELLKDGMCFKDEGEDFFGTDKFIEYFGLENNVFNQEMFEEKIYKDDLPQYKNIIEKLTKKRPNYTTTYRVKNKGNIVWIKETGKKIFLNKKVSLISVIKPMDIRQFPESEIDVLNQLPIYKNMYEEIQKLVRQKVPFTLLMIHLSNVPNINEKYGRDVGDLMMGEYLKKLRYNFIKDNHSLYRVGGINFALIIKDERKVELIDRALTHGGDLFNLTMVFGGITQTLFPNLGISESPYEGKNADQVIEEALNALKITLKDSYDANYRYYDRN